MYTKIIRFSTHNGVSKFSSFARIPKLLSTELWVVCVLEGIIEEEDLLIACTKDKIESHCQF